jgi:4-hydroxy-3-methylbut-2-en-1-yl diphosphate reductase
MTYLADHGFADVQEYVEVKESLLFALPPELRRDMRAKAEGNPVS